MNQLSNDVALRVVLSGAKSFDVILVNDVDHNGQGNGVFFVWRDCVCSHEKSVSYV